MLPSPAPCRSPLQLRVWCVTTLYMRAGGGIVSWHLPGSVHSDSLCVCAPQVERLETKVVTPLKFYGPQIKQTRVSEDATLRGAQWLGLPQPEPQETALLLPLG